MTFYQFLSLMTKQPNVLFLLSDEHSYRCFSHPDDLDGVDLSAAIRTGQEPTCGPVATVNCFTPETHHYVLRDGRYKYIRCRESIPDLLFDLENDPLEQTDLLRHGEPEPKRQDNEPDIFQQILRWQPDMINTNHGDLIAEIRSDFLAAGQLFLLSFSNESTSCNNSAGVLMV